MSLITVIIPFYNSEKYIENCIYSVLNQSYKNLEILLINDGSTDNSIQICRRIAKQDGRLKIINKPNGGVSSARNIGLDHAKGNYVTFIDSDDSICEKTYEKMMNFTTGNNDIVCCGVKRVNEKNQFLYNTDEGEKGKIFSPKEAMVECLKNGSIGFNVYTKLFNIKLFNNGKRKVRFPEGRLMEEAAILPEIFLNSNSIIHCGYNGYMYYVRENSYTTKPLSKECFYIYDTINTYNETLELMFPGTKDELETWGIINCMNLYRRAIIEKKIIDNEVYLRAKKEFEKTYVKGLLKNNISLKNKILLLETKTKLLLMKLKIRQLLQKGVNYESK